MTFRFRLAVVVTCAALVLAACGGGDDDDASGDQAGTGSKALTGLLRIDAGSCAAAGVTAGSWFRMVQPGGKPDAGPFVTNGDSSCGDKTWTPLLPGTDGGLRLGDYQPAPEPAFDAGGNSTATLITKPTPWFAVSFGLATNPTDPQTKKAVPAPTLTVEDGKLTGSLTAFAAAWNGQHFNQGVPKPDGSRPGNTSGPTGTYDEATGKVVLEWRSQIVGGPFNNFTGVWHLEGVLAAG